MVTIRRRSALDEAEFRDFVAARSRALLRAAYLLTGDQQHAEDLLQAAFERAIPRWGSLRSSAAAEAYVRRVMYREQISIWRRRASSERPMDVLPEPRGTGDPDRVEQRLDLFTALRRLGNRQRAVLVLRYFEDLTEEQAAEVLGISVGTVKSQCHRGLARLRELCPDYAPTPGGEPR